MILIAFFQIPLNKFFPLESLETLLRQLVLWVGLLGATLAARDGRHINIDILSRFLTGKIKKITTILTNLFATCICSLLTLASFQVVADARAFGETVPIFINVPTWRLQSILVFGFGVLTFRFFLKALNTAFAWAPPQEVLP
jgi:TRAP-type C4-dicarboxylate transport system permease small subunit